MRKRYLIGFFSVILLISMGLTWKLKMSVRPPLAKELLDLPYIVNEVDELGGDNFQLNWQEIVAIIAMDPKKRFKSNFRGRVTATSFTFY